MASVTGSLNVGDKQMSILQVGFLTADPRLLVVAVSTQVGEQLGIHAFSVSKEPLKYPEALLIGSDEGYFGEIDFKLDWQRALKSKLKNNGVLHNETGCDYYIFNKNDTPNMLYSIT